MHLLPQPTFLPRQHTLALLIALAAWLALMVPAHGADLLRILPITDKILLLQFREGHIRYGGVRADGTYAPQTENRIVYSPFNLDAAVTPPTYRLTSSDDERYTAPQHPLRLGLKAKGHDFHGPQHQPPYLREYLVYAEIPTPLRPGCTYTVDVGDLAGNRRSATFVFDAGTLRTPTVHLSHVGFTPDAPKFAYFSQWMGTFNSPEHPDGSLNLDDYTDSPFHLVEADTGRAVRTYRGLTLHKEPREPDLANPNWAQSAVYSLDFSDFTTPGRYRLVAERMGCSWPFEIGPDVYAHAHRTTLRSLFLQRRGIEKQLVEFDRVYPRSHHPDLNGFVYGQVEGEGASIADPRKVEGLWGWYADAGDWDSYPSHSLIPYVLLFTWDLRPEHFHDGDYNNIWRERPSDPWHDEGRNGLPDILDEARWLIEFWRRARHELMRQGLGTGGVPGYVGRDAGAHYQPSWNDDRLLYVDLEQAGTTYAYAGAAAYYAYCLNKVSGGQHPDSAGWLVDAREAFRWASAHDDGKPQTNRFRHVGAAGLYLATGDNAFQEDFRRAWQSDPQRTDGGWISIQANMISAAIYAWSAASHPTTDHELVAEVTANLLQRADRVIAHEDRHSFRVGGLDEHQTERMNLITVPRVFFQVVAHALTGQPKYLRSIHQTLAFVLGGNPEGYSRLTGVGHQSDQDAFIPDAWYLLDYNHPAYRNPVFPGYSAYGVLSTWDVAGPGSETWARSSTIPDIDRWPIAEQRMRSRYSIGGSEWTIHQNQPWWVLATGYLLPADDRPLQPFTRPSVHLILPPDHLDLAQPLNLRVNASPDTARVEYYLGWRLIGESENRRDGFAVTWQPLASALEPGATQQVTAIAFDELGRSSLPAARGERILRTIARTGGTALVD